MSALRDEPFWSSTSITHRDSNRNVSIGSKSPWLESHAVTIYTVDANGLPDARVLILKDVDHVGFHFAINAASRNGLQIEERGVEIKWVARPAIGFKSFRSAAATLSGVELMHVIRKGQLRTTGKLLPAKRFYALPA